jgi:hypothetical protein
MCTCDGCVRVCAYVYDSLLLRTFVCLDVDWKRSRERIREATNHREDALHRAMHMQAQLDRARADLDTSLLQLDALEQHKEELSANVVHLTGENANLQAQVRSACCVGLTCTPTVA